MTRLQIASDTPWGMRVAQPGRTLEMGPPYLFSGEYSPLRIHQSGRLQNVWNYYEGAGGYNYLGPYAVEYLEVPFPDLGYVPTVLYAVTSSYFGGTITFPDAHNNYVPQDENEYYPYSARIHAHVFTNRVVFYGTTQAWGFLSGNDPSGMANSGTPARQGDIYYTVFKNREPAL